jgi:ribose-phosphate pyrophosphokinase
VVHAIFAEDAFSRLLAVTSQILSTDAVPHQSNLISVAPPVASAIRSDS